MAARRASARGVGGQEHLDHIGGAVHTAGGIDARGDAEGDLSGAGRLTLGKSGNVEERAQSGIGDLAQTFQTAFDDHTIFSRQRNDVGDGGDGYDF